MYLFSHSKSLCECVQHLHNIDNNFMYEILSDFFFALNEMIFHNENAYISSFDVAQTTDERSRQRAESSRSSNIMEAEWKSDEI